MLISFELNGQYFPVIFDDEEMKALEQSRYFGHQLKQKIFAVLKGIQLSHSKTLTSTLTTGWKKLKRFDFHNFKNWSIKIQVVCDCNQTDGETKQNSHVHERNLFHYEVIGIVDGTVYVNKQVCQKLFCVLEPLPLAVQKPESSQSSESSEPSEQSKQVRTYELDRETETETIQAGQAAQLVQAGQATPVA